MLGQVDTASTVVNGMQLQLHTWAADPAMCSMGQALTVAWARPGSPCSTPGPLTVSSAAGVPVRKPAAAAAYPAACSLRKLMKRMPAACRSAMMAFWSPNCVARCAAIQCIVTSHKGLHGACVNISASTL
jgi:hypothetical protein